MFFNNILKPKIARQAPLPVNRLPAPPSQANLHAGAPLAGKNKQRKSLNTYKQQIYIYIYIHMYIYIYLYIYMKLNTTKTMTNMKHY